MEFVESEATSVRYISHSPHFRHLHNTLKQIHRGINTVYPSGPSDCRSLSLSSAINLFY